MHVLIGENLNPPFLVDQDVITLRFLQEIIFSSPVGSESVGRTNEDIIIVRKEALSIDTVCNIVNGY